MQQLEDLIVSIADPESPEAEILIHRLDADLHARYPNSSIHVAHSEELKNDRGFFVIAWCQEQPLGCGAIRFLERGVGELKRMYVEPKVRGRGVGRKILVHLETESSKRGLHTLRLETGERQPEAIRLYETFGYNRIPAFGEYVGDPLSICFEKVLHSGG